MSLYQIRIHVSSGFPGFSDKLQIRNNLLIGWDSWKKKEMMEKYFCEWPAVSIDKEKNERASVETYGILVQGMNVPNPEIPGKQGILLQWRPFLNLCPGNWNRLPMFQFPPCSCLVYQQAATGELVLWEHRTNIIWNRKCGEICGFNLWKTAFRVWLNIQIII